MYKSELCDRACEHNHRTDDAAQRCAKRRIEAGELRLYLGERAKPNLEFGYGYYTAEWRGGIKVGG